jgi:hypothetical protein
MNIKLVLIACILLKFMGIQAQQRPAEAQQQTLSIQGATAHTGTGEIIKNSLIVFSNGKIDYIGDHDEEQEKGKVINANGKHIYPGFIAPNATLGLAEIDAVKATRDEDELGKFLPHIRSLIAYNTESKVVESMRPNGVLMGQITPRGGRISGTSSIVQFDAWHWEDAVVKKDDAVHLNWPTQYKRKSYGFGGGKGWKINKKYGKEVDQLKDYFKRAKAYAIQTPEDEDLAFEAMRGLFSGQKKLYVHSDATKCLLDMIAFKKQFDLPEFVVVGGYRADRVANELKDNDIPVLVQRVHSLPRYQNEDFDHPYKLPAQLVEKGVLVGLEGSGRMERMNSRNIPFYAGTTAGYGLTKEQALQLITYNTAKILGIDEHYGSLEKGKRATFFISEGDALDMQGNQLTRAFIDGREISLESHQTQLYKKFKEKYAKQEE